MQPRYLVATILAKSLHFSFIAMKRWKFQDHCDESDECDEITKEIFFWSPTFFIAFLCMNIFQTTKNWHAVACIMATHKCDEFPPFHCDEFSLQRFFSLWWIHCLLASIVATYFTKPCFTNIYWVNLRVTDFIIIILPIYIKDLHKRRPHGLWVRLTILCPNVVIFLWA